MPPIVVPSTAGVGSMQAASGSVTAGIDTILSVALSNGSRAADRTAVKAVTSAPLVVSNPSGLHARPAAVLASRAKQYEADVQLRRGQDQVNARSVVAIMGLEIGRGDRVEIIATGPDAEEAVRSLSQLILDGLGEDARAPAVVETAAPAVVGRPERSTDPNLLVGVAASPGLAVGNVV